MKNFGKSTSSEQSRPRVALGMSGGVDSSLCAHLLIESGYDVTGVYLECWRAPGCRTEEDRKDALAVALTLGIPFKVLDFKQAYHDKVVEYFFAEYAAGRTPNPDVMCNKEIKFGLFYDWAIAEGFDFVATGHYAKITGDRAQRGLDGPQLTIPADLHKDQTYFLYVLSQDQLAHTLFPLAELHKTEVRKAAAARKISVATKKDSVGICFIGDINVHEFLKERLGENPGDVVDTSGTVIGQHSGLWFYTIGQRHGFTISPSSQITLADGRVVDRTNIPPFYVIAKDAAQNRLVVGFGREALKESFIMRSPHWIGGQSPLDQGGQTYSVRIRHTGELIPCTFSLTEDEEVLVNLEQSTKGIADGQAGVVYRISDQGTFCIGGGTIGVV